MLVSLGCCESIPLFPRYGWMLILLYFNFAGFAFQICCGQQLFLFWPICAYILANQHLKYGELSIWTSCFTHGQTDKDHWNTLTLKKNVKCDDLHTSARVSIILSGVTFKSASFLCVRVVFDTDRVSQRPVAVLPVYERLFKIKCRENCSERFS